MLLVLAGTPLAEIWVLNISTSIQLTFLVHSKETTCHA